MTEAQAWRKIARAFERYWQSRVRTQLTRFGLCVAIGYMPERLRLSMLERLAIMSSWPGSGWAEVVSDYFWKIGVGNAKLRATAAGLLAAQADEEKQPAKRRRTGWTSNTSTFNL